MKFLLAVSNVFLLLSACQGEEADNPKKITSDRARIIAETQKILMALGELPDKNTQADWGSKYPEETIKLFYEKKHGWDSTVEIRISNDYYITFSQKDYSPLLFLSNKQNDEADNIQYQTLKKKMGMISSREKVIASAKRYVEAIYGKVSNNYKFIEGEKNPTFKAGAITENGSFYRQIWHVDFKRIDPVSGYEFYSESILVTIYDAGHTRLNLS